MKDFRLAISRLKMRIRLEYQLLEISLSLAKIENESVGQYPKQLLTSSCILILVLG